MRVLVVEADSQAQAALRDEFAAMQVAVTPAGDAASALAALAQEGLSLAVVNYDVEGGGLPLIARLQAAARARGAQLDVFVTAEQEVPALKAAAAKMQVQAILLRPVRRLCLARAMADLLSARVDRIGAAGNGNSSKAY
jgi:DNA-binding response OmpR family regulator